MTNKHFCIIPWIHMHIWPNGVTYPCCLATNDYVLGNTNDKSFEELWNSPRMKLMRKNMLDDKPTTGCSRCYEHESTGVESMRLSMNKNFAHHFDRADLTNPDGSVDDVYMAYMDIRFSNICNFRCRSCGPELSSNWVDDAVKLGRYDPAKPKILKIRNTLDELWDDMESWIDTVEQIYFAGGEPLIMDEHYKILDHLIKIGKTDIKLAYNTNFSKLTFKSNDVIQLWQNFERVNLGASLDAMGPRAELMRKGTVWNDIEKNRRRLLDEAPHVQFQVSCTVSAYNAWHCFDFFDDWIERGWVTPQQVDLNLLLYPEHMRAQVLPEHFRKKIQDKARDYIKRHNLEEVDVNGRSFAAANALIEFLETGHETNWNLFELDNKSVDDLRNETLYDVFPELRFND